MYADNMCFYGYDSTDMKHYSTNLYKDKAVAAIEAHDYSKSSLFMYVYLSDIHSRLIPIHPSTPSHTPNLPSRTPN